MAVTEDASSQYSNDALNATPITYQGPVVSAPAGTRVLAFASCEGPPSNPTSNIAITAVSGGHTAFELITLNPAGFGADSPITCWSFVANGTPFQVTQEASGGATGSQSQAVVVLNGVTGAITTGNFRGIGTPEVSDTSPAAGSMAVWCMNDSPNAVDTLVEGYAPMVTRFQVGGTADQIPFFAGYLSLGGAGFTIGCALPANQGGSNGIMIMLEGEATDVVADAEVASGAAVANAATTLVSTSTGVSAASATALDAGAAVSLGGGVAAAAGAALDAAVLMEVVASAGAAAGAGAALGAGSTVEINAGVAGGTGQALSPTVSEGGDVAVYTFGPCEPWTPIWPRGQCAEVLLDPAAPEVTGAAVQAASEILYQLTAQRFGLCTVTLRPCRQSCMSNFAWGNWWQYGSYPQPYWWNGTWYNLACGSCPNDSCSCVALEETTLPGPVYRIVEVKLNGTVLTDGVDYRVDDYRKLVRLGGNLWPFCQNMNLADTENDTWSVTAEFGEVVPVLGQLAVGELALEIVKDLLCEDCALPQGVTDISRQGISMTIANVSDLFNTGFIQLRKCDLFIKTANPYHLQSRSAVYDLDSPTYRAWGTS